MSQPLSDPFAVLGIPRDADTATIKQAYFTLVREHPPERDPVAFKRIRAAYEQLRDPQQRMDAMMQLLRPWQPDNRQRRAPRPNLRVQPADVLHAAALLGDLGRTDWREHYRKVEP